MAEETGAGRPLGSLLDLESNVAVVTGGSGGIGAAKVDLLRTLGGHVAVLDLEPTDKADLWIEADVSKNTDVTRAVDDIQDAFGRVDVFVNNAGIAPPGRFDELAEEDWHRTLDVNLTSVFLCTRAILSLLRAAGGGRVINVASIAGRHRSLTASAAYTAAKGGVISLTRQLAQELASIGYDSTALVRGSPPRASWTATSTTHVKLNSPPASRKDAWQTPRRLPRLSPFSHREPPVT